MTPGTSAQIDVLVIGGGLTGLALAATVGAVGGTAALVERQQLEELVEPAHDGRVTAIARGGKRLLDRIGAWDDLAGDAEPILDIVVGEAGSPVTVRYDHRAAGSEPLGWIVPNRTIRLALMHKIAALPSVEVLAPASPVRLERGTTAVTAMLADGRTVRSSLLAACEGRRSSTREAAGIGARHWGYGQTGIVATILHERPHGGLALERFFSDGPLAVLPMRAGEAAPRRSSIVWALRDDVATDVLELDGPGFTTELQDRIGDRVGRIVLEGRRWSYPLSLVWADSYVADRLVLVGDTARAIHPIAGQGWNLALRDIAAIAQIVRDRRRVGLDPGDAIALERYAAWRAFDSLALVAATDGINRLFANDLWPIRLARNLGLAAVERTGPAKRFFMRHAMGLVGELPALMQE